MASGRGKHQRHACVLLKVMHILHHLDARELRTRLALSDAQLFEAVEQSVLEIFEWVSAQAARRAHDSPAVNALWGRLSEVAEMISLSELEEAERPFPHFEAV